MNPDRPIACSLSGSGLKDRHRELGRFGSKNLIGRSSDAKGQSLRFRRTEDSTRSLREIVAAERECCPFLDLELIESAEELELRIAAPEDARVVADELAAAFG
ncbi:MAG TPA: hypothetical protein VGH14_18960 [Solirubrobacterales bacterium]|jgi:hypothetical protein